MMKQTIKIFFGLSCVLLLFITACDKIEGPYKEKIVVPTVDTVVRKVLFEEFTGHTCPNCPAASWAAYNLKKNTYGERLVLVSIHAGELAAPLSGTFSYDFTTTEGTALGAFLFGNEASIFTPVVLINRKGINDGISAIVPQGQWAQTINTYTDDVPTASIEITNSYNDGLRQVNTTIDTKVLDDLSGDYMISAYLTEDGVVKPQDSASITKPNYIHRHVLRGSFNGLWGDQIITESALKDEEFSNSYTLTLGADWNPDHCSVVAFIYDATTKEVIQVEEKKIN